MLKSKKVKIAMAVIFIKIIIAIILFFVYRNSIYSLEKVKEILTSANTLKNVHIKEEIFMGDYSDSIEFSNYYIKDNMMYINQENDSLENTVETIYNFENSKEISINHSNKTINVLEVTEKPSITLPENDNFFTLANLNKQYEHRGTYKYIGKESIDGQRCIKVSLTDNYEDKVSVHYYYINLENNCIIRYELYEGNDESELKKNYEAVYTYTFNTVTDNDILNFDKNNYPDYTYYE